MTISSSLSSAVSHDIAAPCSPVTDGPSIDAVYGKHGALYIAFDPQQQGSAHLRVHLYSGNVFRPGNMMGLGSVSLVAAVQAGAVSVHLLDRFGQVGCLFWKHRSLLATRSCAQLQFAPPRCRTPAMLSLSCTLSHLQKPLVVLLYTWQQQTVLQQMQFLQQTDRRLSPWSGIRQSHHQPHPIAWYLVQGPAHKGLTMATFQSLSQLTGWQCDSAR